MPFVSSYLSWALCTAVNAYDLALSRDLPDDKIVSVLSGVKHAAYPVVGEYIGCNFARDVVSSEEAKNVA